LKQKGAWVDDPPCVLREKHPREQGLKHQPGPPAMQAIRLREKHPREQGLKLTDTRENERPDVLREKHPREQGLKLCAMMVNT